MMTNSQNVILKKILPILVFTIVILGIIAGFIRHDPHWLNRAGAAIASIAAAAILLQILAELKIEEDRSQLDKEYDGLRFADQTSPMSNLEVRLALKRIELKHAELTTTRLGVAVYVISYAIVGELLHGFGDILMCQLFYICASH